METNVLLGRLKQLRHVLLREPDGLALKPHVDLQFPVLRLVNEELAARRGCPRIFAHGFGLLWFELSGNSGGLPPATLNSPLSSCGSSVSRRVARVRDWWRLVVIWA